MLAAQIAAEEEDPLFHLGLAGREYYETTAGPLKDMTGIDIGVRLHGILSVAKDESAASLLKDRVAWQRQQGHLCDWLDRDELAEQCPWLSKAAGGLLAPRDGALDPLKLVEALRADAKRLGVTLAQDTITALTRSGDLITGARGKSIYSAAATIVAAGAWSGRLEGLPRPISVEPSRGQMLAFPWPQGVVEGIFLGTDIYMVPRNGEAICGSTMEHVGFQPVVTSEGIRGIEERIRALCPALRGVASTRSWSGLRPGTPDGLPIIGAEPSVRGLWYATGHGRNGILLAGITALILERLMAGEVLFEEVGAVRPERFWSR